MRQNVDKDTDERLQELHDRLVTWWFGSPSEGSELKEVWEDALRRFDVRLHQVLADNPTAEERIMETPKDMLLDCFEASLADHDHLLATVPPELPEGWHEWPPLPPEV